MTKPFKKQHKTAVYSALTMVFDSEAAADNFIATKGENFAYSKTFSNRKWRVSCLPARALRGLSPKVTVVRPRVAA